MSTNPRNQHLYGRGVDGSAGVITQSANDVLIARLRVRNTVSSGPNSHSIVAYFPYGALPATVVRDCLFEANGVNAIPMSRVDYAGTYERCVGGDYSFGNENASGRFVNCTAGNFSFAGQAGTASGTFIDCTAGVESFGGSYGLASGTFLRCKAGNWSFGTRGEASGRFTECEGGTHCFGGDDGIASGTFIGCVGGDYSFGGGGRGAATGIFRRCKSGLQSFGGGSGTYNHANGGIFEYCVGGASSFTEVGTPAPRHFYCVSPDQFTGILSQYAGND